MLNMRVFKIYFAFFLCMLGIVLVTSDDNYQEFYNDLLILHNELRDRHYAKALTLDQELSDIAMERAEKLLELKVKQPIDDGVYGMNFFGRIVLNNNIPDAIEVFRSWYNEIIYYKYNTEPITDDTASFTQIVWQSTLEVGFAMVRDPYYVMVIAIYKPKGNIEGEFDNNVSKRKE